MNKAWLLLCGSYSSRHQHTRGLGLADWWSCMWGGGLLTQEACPDSPVGLQAAPLPRLPLALWARQTPPVKPLVERWLRGEDG